MILFIFKINYQIIQVFAILSDLGGSLLWFLMLKKRYSLNFFLIVMKIHLEGNLIYINKYFIFGY